MALPSSMTEALRLTRTGNLAEATALIQNALSGGNQPVPGIVSPKVVDLVSERVAIASRQQRSEPASRSAVGRFEARSHVGPAGAIDYMLYRPAGAVAGMPLVVMLHGCTQSPEDFARGTRMNAIADELGFVVAYPRQTSRANPQKCWNWFRPGDQQRDRGEPALIAGITKDIVTAEQSDSARVYVAGLSAGGAAAAIMAEIYPDLFAAVGIHSGVGYGAARDVSSAMTAMRHGRPGAANKRHSGDRFVPVITFHGDRDGTVHEMNARNIVEAATAATGVPVTVEAKTGEAGGRRYTRAISRDGTDQTLIEQWTIAGAGHAWSGGDPAGSYADASGPEASRMIIRFFLDHPKM